jgi:hypothetical protein
MARRPSSTTIGGALLLGVVWGGVSLLIRLGPWLGIAGTVGVLAAAFMAHAFGEARAVEMALSILVVGVGFFAVTLPDSIVGEWAAILIGIALLGWLALAMANEGGALRRAVVYLGMTALVGVFALLLSTTEIGGIDRVGFGALLIVVAIGTALYFWVASQAPSPTEQPTS